MDALAFHFVEQTPGVVLGEVDLRAIERIISWQVQPQFGKPGRTGWHVLQEPVSLPNGGPVLRAAKLKGVGAWNPTDRSVRSGVRGDNPTGICRPSTREYEETARALHFGIDANGEFANVNSEAAPFGAITLRRAKQEYDNALTLYNAGVPSIVPYALCRYGGDETFNGQPLGVAVSLTPDESPYSLDFLYIGERSPTPARKAHFHAVCNSLQVGEALTEGAFVAAQARVAYGAGRALRRFAQSGLYRYSSAWDNFYLNKRSAEIYLTDLDSSRQLSELPEEIRGMQVLRDLAGALYRLPKQWSQPAVIDDFHLSSLRDAEALGSIISGFFDIADIGFCRKVVEPLWAYFTPHWFLLKRHGSAASQWPEDLHKSYMVDKDVFNILAILVVADLYNERSKDLGLPAAPSREVLRARMLRFLGERMDLVESLIPRVPA